VGLRASSRNLARRGGQEGVVLLLVLWALGLLSLLILSWTEESRIELKLTENFRAAHQSRRLAEAGIYYALGKLVENLINEGTAQGARTSREASTAAPGSSGDWQPDQRPHVLKLTTGKVEIRIADEAGKINLNLADEKTLARLLAALGVSESQVTDLAEAIMDWRTSSSAQVRPTRSTADYYRNLDPPYSLKADKFDVVEELAWVKGFRGSPMLPRLLACLTVQQTGAQINLNTAPSEVLQALGMGQDQVQALIQGRTAQPLRQLSEVPAFTNNPLAVSQQSFGFRASPFFTILSTGVINRKGGRHTIKAVVRLNVNAPTPWRILFWDDDYPVE
jgi:general secretion pathway protein K